VGQFYGKAVNSFG